MTHPRPSNWGGPRAGLAALVLVAAALRLAGIRYGLPYGSLLDPAEQELVPRAWRMVHGAGADPGFYERPTLVTYLEAPLQWWQDAPSYLTARLVVVVLALGGVALAWWLGSRAYGTIAGAVAAGIVAVDSTHVALSHAALTDVPLATFTTLALALLVTGRVELAGVAIGLATAAKYPGVVLLVPLAVVAWRKWRQLGAAVALAAVAFFAASPYVVLRAGDAWSAIDRAQAQHRRGLLGFEHDHWSGIAFADRLWEGMGPAFLIAVAGLVLALAQRRSRADVALGSFVVAYYVALLPWHSHFAGFALPLVPALGALAGRLRGVAPVTLLLLVVPLTGAVRDDVRLTRTDSRVLAARWIERNIPAGALVAADPTTVLPAGYRRLALRLPLPGTPPDPSRDLAALRARGVRWILVTGAVEDQVVAARDRYPREAAFVGALERDAQEVFRREPEDRRAPWTAVYRA